MGGQKRVSQGRMARGRGAKTRRQPSRFERRVRRSGSPTLVGAVGAAIVVSVALLVMAILPGERDATDPTLPMTAPAVEVLSQPVQRLDVAVFTPTPAPTAAPTAVPTAAPTVAPTAVPEAFEYLPVYKRANIDDPVIAITVDDCFQLENLKEIAALAHKSGGKLTIFPIGENIMKPGMADVLKACAFKLGFEIENHTWSHARVFRMSEQEMAAEIWKQSAALNQALGVNYQQHFFRLMGGDGNNDQRTHNYLRQLGFKGIADWSLSGSDADMEQIKSHLQPGAIYLFHTTDADTKKLRKFIPWVAAQGYRMVTMNELLGFDANATSQYTPTEMPQPRSYVTDYRTHRKGDYAWIIVQMQDRLRKLGYLVMDGPSTGYYGPQTAEAILAYQRSAGLDPTGEADAETQRLLLSN